MVYTSHNISIDRDCVAKLKNNGTLHILVKQLPESIAKTLNHTDILLRTYECYGLVENNEVLFRMETNLVPLEEILKNIGRNRVRRSRR